jgi:hypothetical protein
MQFEEMLIADTPKQITPKNAEDNQPPGNDDFYELPTPLKDVKVTPTSQHRYNSLKDHANELVADPPAEPIAELKLEEVPETAKEPIHVGGSEIK